MSAIIVNLIGAPGTGKSTLMAAVFAKLKCEGYDAELVSEFAKELVYEDRMGTMKDELYIFAKQAHRLFCVSEKVEIVVTDRPLILTIAYNNRYAKGTKELNDLVVKTFKDYDNINFFLHRISPYMPNGRVQTEAESDEISNDLKNILDENDIEYGELDAEIGAVDIIVEEVKRKIEEIRNNK